MTAKFLGKSAATSKAATYFKCRAPRDIQIGPKGAAVKCLELADSRYGNANLSTLVSVLRCIRNDHLICVRCTADDGAVCGFPHRAPLLSYWVFANPVQWNGGGGTSFERRSNPREVDMVSASASIAHLLSHGLIAPSRHVDVRG